MKQFKPETDAYIEKAEDFAKPILTHIRKLVHEAEPDIVEAIKWSHVHFDFKGPVCHMAGYTRHCNFGFWKTALIADPEGILKTGDTKSPLNGLTSIADLPADEILIWYIRSAVELNKQGVKYSPFKSKKSKETLIVPKDLTEMLEGNTQAQMYFDDFTIAQRNEYFQWINDAKTEITRQKRLETTIEWLAEGKTRNWKYK